MTQEAHRKTTKTHDPSRGLSGRISSFWELSLSLGKINLILITLIFSKVSFSKPLNREKEKVTGEHNAGLLPHHILNCESITT